MRCSFEKDEPKHRSFIMANKRANDIRATKNCALKKRLPFGRHHYHYHPPYFSSTENLLNIPRPWGPCYLPVEGREGGRHKQTKKEALLASKVNMGKASMRGRVLNPWLEMAGRSHPPNLFLTTAMFEIPEKIWALQSPHGSVALFATQVEKWR